MSAPDRLAALRAEWSKVGFVTFAEAHQDIAYLLAEVGRLRAEAARAHDLAGEVMALRGQLHRRRAVAAPTEGGTHRE